MSKHFQPFFTNLIHNSLFVCYLIATTLFCHITINIAINFIRRNGLIEVQLLPCQSINDFPTEMKCLVLTIFLISHTLAITPTIIVHGNFKLQCDLIFI